MSEENKKEQESSQELENQNPENTTELTESAKEEKPDEASEEQETSPVAEEKETTVDDKENKQEEKVEPQEVAATGSEENAESEASDEPESDKPEENTEVSSPDREIAQTDEDESAETEQPVAEAAQETRVDESEESTAETTEVATKDEESELELESTPVTAVEPATEDPVEKSPEVKENPKAEEAPTSESTSEEQSDPVEKEAPAAEAESQKAEAGTETKEDPEPKEEEIDYSSHSREELVEAVEELAQREKYVGLDAIVNQIVPLFNDMEKGLKESALNKFIVDGGVVDDFQFKRDELFNRFDASVRLIRDKRARFFKEREANKEKNYEKKLALLDRLRELVDGEDATTNISPIKEIQQEWRNTGAVPNQHNKTLWANYNALLDRFYNHRHILFELKELDRKKNQVLKEELCAKAEALNSLEDIKAAIVQLNELHEEYKKVGPVPREVQEPLWQRFKAASDEIYKKRKVYLDDLKGELQENLIKKKALAEEIKSFIAFNSERINDWNAKTKEVIAIQKKWEALGGLPREHAKEVNKDFWSSFKTFFSHKNEFFKRLEGKRKENLEAKEKLVEEARALKDNQDWDKTADKLKVLQRQWKDVGPVPEKFRNSVYADFKAACDEFFDNRRESLNKAEEGYADNLKLKEALCDQIEANTKKKEGSTEDVDQFTAQWKEVGFVPKNAVRKIEERFKNVLEAFVAAIDVPEEEREGLIMKAQLSGLSKGPNADRNIQKKEGAIRRQIQELENDIGLWNNNLSFFANSKTADKLKKEFDDKIEKAEEELRKLKKQLRFVRSI